MSQIDASLVTTFIENSSVTGSRNLTFPMPHPNESELRQELERLTKERDAIETAYFNNPRENGEAAERVMTITRRILEIQAQLHTK